MVDKFYGSDKVDAIIDDGEYTVIRTVDGKERKVATSELGVLITDEAISPTDLRKSRCNPIAAGCLMLMKKYNIRADEVDFVMDLIIKSINENTSEAAKKLWKVEYIGEQTFVDIDDVLKS